MNPYVLTGLAMCMIIVIALVGTSYLAVYFTRRAKADLERLLTPLAAAIDGEVDVDEAEVRGSWDGNLVSARMANAAAGTVRIFQVDMVDPAGGTGWNYVYSRPRKDVPEPEIEFITDDESLREELPSLAPDRIATLSPNERDWLQVEYNPDAGFVRLARPIKGRNEIPDTDRFEADLTYLGSICNENRAAQERRRVDSTGEQA